MSSDWIEGRFEGVYSGQRSKRSGAEVLGCARQFSFELQSGNVCDVRQIAAPVDPVTPVDTLRNGDASAATNTIRLKRIEHVSMPVRNSEGLVHDEDAALAGSRETCLFDVRIHDWRLAHPAEVAGRSFGTLYGTIRARLTPVVEERPLELTRMAASATSNGRIDVHEVAAKNGSLASDPPESIEASPQTDEFAPGATHSVGGDPAVAIARFWWAVRILAALLFAAGLANACSSRTAAVWLAAIGGALLARLVRPRATAVRPALQHGLGCALVALQLSVLYGPAELAWQRGCLTSISSQLLWLGAPVAVAGWMRIRWPFWISAALWTAVLCSWCSQLDEETCSVSGAPPVASTSSAAQARHSTPNRAAPSGPRTDADGRWPVMPSASSTTAAPPFWPSPAPTQTSQSSGPRAALTAGPTGSLDETPSEDGPAVDGRSSRPLSKTGNPAQEPLQLHAARDSRPPRNPPSTRAGGGATATDGVPGGWVTPDHREAARSAVMISIEHANRAPDEFYMSTDERRVYLPTDSIFVHGGSSLRPGGDLDLMRVSALLSLPDTPRVEIEVHTDAGGSRTKQLELSRRRAANIRSWLLDRGHVDAQRFDVHGAGSSYPVVPPDGSYTAQSPNRRIEIRVVK